MTENTTRVGIGVAVFNDNGHVLLGRRKGSHGAGEYAFPGGHLEYGETFESCARREVMEECGIEITDVEFVLVANVMAYLPKHYVHLTLRARLSGGTPTLQEPDKCSGWAFYPLDALPAPLFAMCTLTLDALRSGRNYYDGV